MTEPAPYNPLDKRNLGASVAEALLGRKPRPLGELKAFHGAGIYSIYYRGPFPAYQRIAALNQGDDPQAPIYVGKAITEGGRKGSPLSDGAKTKALYRRLKEHAESIQSVAGLELADFACRYLAVDDIWIPLGESLLIAKFSPLWNVFIDGFGNHDPGAGRYKGLQPRWDVLHPGRAWAAKCAARNETPEQIIHDIQTRLGNESTLVRSRFLVEQQRAEYIVRADQD